ncbi:hypothetical protein ACOMHN_018230 [Nucella lapillus]
MLKADCMVQFTVGPCDPQPSIISPASVSRGLLSSSMQSSTSNLTSVSRGLLSSDKEVCKHNYPCARQEPALLHTAYVSLPNQSGRGEKARTWAPLQTDQDGQGLEVKQGQTYWRGEIHDLRITLPK